MICGAKDEKNFDAIEKLIQKEIPRVDDPLAKIEAAPSDETPEEKKDSKPRRSRGGRGRSKSTETVQDAQTDAPAPVQAEAPKEPAKAEKREDEPKQDQERSRNAGNSRNRRNDRGGRDNNVVGMGDHMPSFIALSFDERRAG